MEVVRKGDELQITIKLGANAERVEALLDYLRFQELAPENPPSQDEIDILIKEAKKGRWERTKKRIGWDEQDPDR